MIKTVSEKVFKDTKGVSYSRLSNLATSPQAYQAALVEEPDSSAITLGTAVDMLLTEPDKFDEQIYVMTTDKPNSDMMLKFVNTLIFTGDANKAHADSGFKLGLDAVLKKFEKEGKGYADALNAAKGRKILDAEDLFKANQIVSTLQSNPYTKKYFIPEDGIELIFQPRILWDLMYHSLLEEGRSTTVQAKSVLDVIRIDHKNKIIQPVDLKTGGEGFMKSYWRYKRYLQGAMYNSAVWKASTDLLDSDYVIEPFKFVFADTNLYYPPVIYEMNDSDIEVGTHGRLQRSFVGNRELSIAFHDSQYRIKGYAQLAAELEWHQKMDQWDYSYDVYQRNGEVDIDAFTFKF